MAEQGSSIPDCLLANRQFARPKQAKEKLLHDLDEWGALSSKWIDARW
jgi:hypothetical protein